MATDVSTPIVHPKSGQAFLESTSFKIGHDDALTNNNRRSIFKSDYPPYGAYGRTGLAIPPPLSEVMHKDARYFNEKSSETVKSFEHRHLPKPELIGGDGKLRVTNFKMDRDLSKFDSFETMNNSYFTPKMPDTYSTMIAPTTHESHIPQGDKEKEPQPLTDYRQKFQGHDTNVHKTIRAPSMHEGGPPTIKGDNRQGHFSTTHNHTFIGTYEKPVETLSAPLGNNVPTGDPSKVVMRETTMKSSFQDTFSQNQTKRYNSEDVSRLLNQTNFKQQDGQYKWNDYNSTATSSFQPSASPPERFHPGKHRNHSDFPGGDLDPARASERVNVTTNRYYQANQPRGHRNNIVSGANLRTRSNVWFGEPPMNDQFYDTTNARTFAAKTVPHTYFRGTFYKNSDIPLDYYSKNERNNTTAFSDYQNPRQGKTIPNPLSVHNLKQSHILPPIGDLGYFSTTHASTFTPKQAEKHSYDAGRLQKSSVPLGTMKTLTSEVTSTD